MCGFLGWFSKSPGAQPPVHLHAALDRIRHRGPDDAGIESGPGWWMGFRRLSILDLSPAAHQPMKFGGSHWLTFNGEIYSHRELRGEFDPAMFRSSGDTELLGRLIERDGAEVAVRRMRGMFAFAWWDADSRTLSLARDAFGIKPLYVHEDGDGILVCSEVAPLRFLLAEKARVNQAALAQFLRWGAVQGPDTILGGIDSLAPGEVRTWSGGAWNSTRYFSPQWLGCDAWWENDRFVLAETRNRVVESVRAHLISDVPVGVFLSGGLDSSIICAAMKELGVPEIRAFSVGYEGDAGVEDESDAARKTAEYLGVQFNVERVSSRGLFDSFDHFINHLDQPSGDALNVYLVARAAARHVKVALSGLGADEMFGGYNHYRMLKLAMEFRAWRFIPCHAAITRLFDSLPARMKVDRAVRTLACLAGARGRSVPELFASARTIMRPEDVRALLPAMHDADDAAFFHGHRERRAGLVAEPSPPARSADLPHEYAPARR